MIKDLTVGKPYSVLWRFCLPLFGSVLFQQMYNLGDSLIAGKFIGENALAAVGNSYEITLIFIAVAFGCNIGCSVIISRYFGAKDYRAVKTTVSTALIFSGGVCAVLMAVGLATGGLLLRLIQTPEVIFADSLLYLNIYLLGLPFLLFYNVSNGIFSALGDSRTPFLFLAFSSTANVAVDALFVIAFHMGVAGVAWATFLCQGVSCLLALTTVFRRLREVPAEGKPERFSKKILAQMCEIGVPSFFQQGSISICNIILQYAINGFGPSVIAGYAAGVKLNNLVITSFTTMGNGISNYASQNYGAGRLDRVREGFAAGRKLMWLLCAPLAVLYFFGTKWVLLLFLDSPTGEAVTAGTLYLRILAPFYFPVTIKLVIDGILRGTGKMREFFIDTFTDMSIRVIVALILCRTALGSTGIWMAWPVGWLVGVGLSIHFYRQGPWMQTADRAEPPAQG